MKPLVLVENLSKRFTRKPNQHRNYGLRDLVKEIVASHREAQLGRDEFYAVSNLSFTLHQGEALALIGRNGCGKSTTLKLICGLLKPTTGTVKVYGRIQPLISLGTGFSHHLSGLDNIRNAAAIQGISAKELRKKTEEIIDFSELREVIDSPISTYSSGMHARLGFSVAVHLDPEILIIDEILGVGDYAFQNKCFAKMNQLQKSGVSIVLVSHSHSRVIQMCDRAIWMHQGRKRREGDPKAVVGQYLKALEAEQQVALSTENENFRREHKERKLKPVLYGDAIYDEEDNLSDVVCEIIADKSQTSSLPCHSSVTFKIRFKLKVKVVKFSFNIVIYRKEDGFHVSKISSVNSLAAGARKPGLVETECNISDFNLAPGSYALLLAVFEGHSFLYRNVIRFFQVTNAKSMAFPNSIVEFDANMKVST